MIEETIGYKFKNKALLKQALSHPSSKSKDNVLDYERMEFLGDSILGFVVSKNIYNKFPDEREGSLAKRKAAVVCKQSLADIALNIGLDEALILGHGEELDGGRENPSNLENSMEALVAAIYLDGGIEQVEKFIDEFFSYKIDKMNEPPKDPKSRLQEHLQGMGKEIPEYEVLSMEGPAHDPIIEIKLKIDDVMVKTSAGSKKKAERKAAEKMLELLNVKN